MFGQKKDQTQHGLQCRITKSAVTDEWILNTISKLGGTISSTDCNGRNTYKILTKFTIIRPVVNACLYVSLY